MFVLVRLLTARVVLAIGMDMGRRRAERVRGKGTANARSLVCACVCILYSGIHMKTSHRVLNEWLTLVVYKREATSESRIYEH